MAARAGALALARSEMRCVRCRRAVQRSPYTTTALLPRLPCSLPSSPFIPEPLPHPPHPNAQPLGVYDGRVCTMGPYPLSHTFLLSSPSTLSPHSLCTFAQMLVLPVHSPPLSPLSAAYTSHSSLLLSSHSATLPVLPPHPPSQIRPKAPRVPTAEHRRPSGLLSTCACLSASSAQAATARWERTCPASARCCSTRGSPLSYG